MTPRGEIREYLPLSAEKACCSARFVRGTALAVQRITQLMSHTRAAPIRRSLALLALVTILDVLLQTTAPVQGLGVILLEDFSSMRTNGEGGALWAPYSNPSGGSDYANQSGSIENGVYHLTTAGRPYFHFLPSPYIAPQGFAHGNLRSGTWSAQVNRLRFWIKAPQTIARRSDGGTIAEVGTYTKPKSDSSPANQGAHFYHYLDPNFIAGRWMLITLNRVPQHQVGMTSQNWPENPTAASGWNYYDGLTRFYFCDEYGTAANWRGDWYFADYGLDIVTGEPDTLVATVAAVHTGSRYELSWQGPKGSVQDYTVRYATASMKQNGLASGTLAGGTVQTSGSDYAGVFWASPALAQPSGGMYFAIQPSGQSAFTEIYLPTGPGGGSGNTTSAPRAPTNVRIIG